MNSPLLLTEWAASLSLPVPAPTPQTVAEIIPQGSCVIEKATQGSQEEAPLWQQPGMLAREPSKLNMRV